MCKIEVKWGCCFNCQVMFGTVHRINAAFNQTPFPLFTAPRYGWNVHRMGMTTPWWPRDGLVSGANLGLAICTSTFQAISLCRTWKYVSMMPIFSCVLDNQTDGRSESQEDPSCYASIHFRLCWCWSPLFHCPCSPVPMFFPVTNTNVFIHV